MEHAHGPKLSSIITWQPRLRGTPGPYFMEKKRHARTLCKTGTSSGPSSSGDDDDGPDEATRADAWSALRGLGLTKPEATQMLARGAQRCGADATVPDLVRAALQEPTALCEETLRYLPRANPSRSCAMCAV